MFCYISLSSGNQHAVLSVNWRRGADETGRCTSLCSTHVLPVFLMLNPRCATSIFAGSHHGRAHPWQRSCGRDLTGKGRWGLKGSPGSAQASTPKPESVCLTILCLSPTLLSLTGGYPRPPFSGKSQLRALVNEYPGHERDISILTPLFAF